MYTFKKSHCCIVYVVTIFLFACSPKPVEVEEIKHYSMDTLDGIIAGTDVQIDNKVTIDQNGSLRITASKPTTVRLFETGDIDIENARLIYKAKLRTAGVEGRVYLEMWCHFPGKGVYFSRAIDASLSGSNEWASQETPFFLKKDQNPDNVKLNLVVDGKGTVWIDDIRLLKDPLR